MKKRPLDLSRTIAFQVLRDVYEKDAYANLALAHRLQVGRSENTSGVNASAKDSSSGSGKSSPIDSGKGSPSGDPTRHWPPPPRRRSSPIDSGKGSPSGGSSAQSYVNAAGISSRDAAFITELVYGTCRSSGSYDRIIATFRDLAKTDIAVVTILRMVAHQILAMRVPVSAAVNTGVDIAASQISEKVAGLVNAIGRRIASKTMPEWLSTLATGMDEITALALRTQHPRWILEAWAQRLPDSELIPALQADNEAPQVNLVIRPGLVQLSDLEDVSLAKYSPFGAYPLLAPQYYDQVAVGKVGVQDEGSQLVTWAFSRVDAPEGAWLDLCAGPGGKTALLTGLMPNRGVAVEVQPQRSRLVTDSIRAYPEAERPVVICADGTRPAWAPESFARVLVDAPCTGLGALRRRPESRWRRKPADLERLVPLQIQLLQSAISATKRGGVIGYVTCSPHRDETIAVIQQVARSEAVEVLPAADYLPEVPNCADGDFVQLWPHRHGTDAMFLALLRKKA